MDTSTGSIAPVVQPQDSLSIHTLILRASLVVTLDVSHGPTYFAGTEVSTIVFRFVRHVDFPTEAYYPNPNPNVPRLCQAK